MTRALVIFFGAGLLRPAPGTWGSLVALVLGMLILHFAGFPVLVLATALVTALGFWACRVELQPGQDPSEVVIDEVSGQWIALLFPAAGFTFAPAAQAALAANGGWLPWPAWVFPFLLFRLFDIWKPGWIGRADRLEGPAGVMLDDVVAGLFAGIATVVLAAAYHIPLVLMGHS